MVESVGRRVLSFSFWQDTARATRVTMPGFVFHFHCDSCGATSDDYSLYVFNDIFRPDIGLPAWSLTHKCWARIYADLRLDQRRAMESDPAVLLEFAASLSSDHMTVGVPQMTFGDSHSIDVKVTPEPRCPYCGSRCRSPFGYTPAETPPAFVPMSVAEFRSAPLSLIDLSVRARNICSNLGIRTVGELEDSRARFAAHRGAAESTMAEIERLLSLKPADEG
jgi:hypothetical protein